MLLLLMMCRPAALLCSARSPDPLGQAAQQHFKSAIQRMDSSNVLLLLMHCSDDYAQEQSAVLSLGLLCNVQSARIGKRRATLKSMQINNTCI
jgi:hypothetical protein